jgi:hypothetical protein
MATTEESRHNEKDLLVRVGAETQRVSAALREALELVEERDEAIGATHTRAMTHTCMISSHRSTHIAHQITNTSLIPRGMPTSNGVSTFTGQFQVDVQLKDDEVAACQELLSDKTYNLQGSERLVRLHEQEIIR